MSKDSMRERIAPLGSQIARRSALGLPLGLAACGFLGGDNGPPLPGRRYNVMASANALVPDPAMSSGVSLPPAVAGADWAQQGGGPAHDPGNRSAANTLNRLWTADLGEGTGYRHRIPCGPVVAGSTVFTMSAHGDVRAFAIDNGGELWHCSIRPEDSRSTDVGGGISYDGGFVYAATGLAEILAIDGRTGKIAWRHPLAAPARSGPTIANGMIYVGLAGGMVVALDGKTGKTLWSHTSDQPQTTILGMPAPAVVGSVVVAGFGSGELAALSADLGEVLWTDNLGSTNPGLSQLSAIVGLPVVDQGRVFVGGLGGLFVSVDMPSGRRLWEKDVATDQTASLAGDWLFLLTADQNLTAIHAPSGSVKWVQQLQPFRNMRKSRGPIFWQGPALAGSTLILANSEGQLITVDPATGRTTSAIDLPAAIAAAPIVAGGKILMVLKSGVLLALG